MNSQISMNNTESKGVPSVNSSDPNERKQARRMRIQARLEAARKEKAIADGTYVEPEPEKPLIHETIETSEDTLRQLYLEGTELISNVMVASDAKEVARREIEEEERNVRVEKLKEESMLALETLDEISSKWEAIMEMNGPLELYQNMKEQKAKCLELIEQKNELIKNFQMELKLADEKFMKGRKAMYEELALLTKRIDEQVLLMKKAYRIEIAHIEEAIDITRSETIEKHQKTWLSLYNQREKEETSNIDSKFQLVESFHEELNKLHVDHEEKYRATRIRLETDIQILEQELEQVKALCLLNSEKLDYNFQVLKKREEENVYIKNHQKRRLNKLQDIVNTLKKKIDEKRQSTDDEYKKLTKDVERYHANILETEKKAERLAQVNSDKFVSIWDMKDEEAKELMEQILAADQVIHEQILGVEWSPPANTTFNKMDLPSFKTAVYVTKDLLKKKHSLPENKIKLLQNNKYSEEIDGEPEFQEGHTRLLRHIFQLVADQSGFLIEEKLDELLKPYTFEEKTFVRLDNVLVAIGVHTQKDAEIMKKVFWPYAVCLICDKGRSSTMSNDARSDAFDFAKNKANSNPPSILQIRELEEKVSKLRLQAKAGDADTTEGRSRFNSIATASSKDSILRKHSRKTTRVPSDTITAAKAEGGTGRESLPAAKEKGSSATKCDILHPFVIEKSLVLKALKDFVTFYNSGEIHSPTEIEQKLIHRRFTISRLVSQEDVTTYWDGFREIFPPKLDTLWDGILIGLTKYLAVLQERHNLNVKAQSLRRQNQELKRLLAFQRVGDSLSDFKLPALLPVPNEPIDTEEILNVSRKLSY